MKTGSRRLKIILKFLPGLWIIIFVLLMATAARASSIAVIAGEGDWAVDAGYVALLEEGIKEHSDIELVQRSTIQNIMAEQRLNLSGGESRNAVELGRLLSARLLVFVEGVPNDIRRIYNIKMIDPLTGIVLYSWLTGDELTAEDFQTITRKIKKALVKSQLDDSQHRYVGILQFKNEEPGTALDGFSELLDSFLAEDLADSPEVVVLDRKHLQYIRQENDLTDLDQTLKASAVLIEGGVKYSPDRTMITVTLIFRSLGSRAADYTDSIQIRADDPLMRVNLKNITRQILNHLKVAPPQIGESDSTQEAAFFMKQVPLLIASGDYEDAISKAEVALVLNPGQETRYWAARAWYSRAQSIRYSPNFTNVQHILTSSGMKRVRRDDVKPSYIKGKQNSDALYVEKKFEHYDEDYNIDTELLQHMLAALIRAYSIIREIMQMHAAYPSDPLIPDPIQDLVVFDAEKRADRSPALNVLLKNADSVSQNLFEMLKDVSISCAEEKRKYYNDHYGLSESVQDAHWENWVRMRDLIRDYFGFDGKRMSMLHEKAFDDFVYLSAISFEPTLRGLVALLELSKALTLSEEDSQLYMRLRHHQDPWVQLLANRLLISNEHLGYSAGMMKTFYENFSAGDNIWSMQDPQLLPDLLRPAIRNLAVSDRSAFLKYLDPIFGKLIKLENLRHMIAWSRTEVFWPYLNAVELGRGKGSVRTLVQQIVTVLDENQTGLTFEEERDAKVLRLELDLKLVQLGDKKEVDEDLWAYETYIQKSTRDRQRPELESPSKSGPLALTTIKDTEKMFEIPDEVKKKGGTYIRTVASDSLHVDANGAGLTYSEGYEYTVDANGNERFTSLDMNPVNEYLKEVSPSSEAWDDYDIEAMSNRVAATNFVDAQPQDYRGLVVHNEILDQSNVYAAQEERLDDRIRITAYQHGILQNWDNLKMGSALIPADGKPSHYITTLDTDDQNLYVGTVNGLLVFEKGTGETIDDPAFVATYGANGQQTEGPAAEESDISGHVRYINAASGLPDNHILSLAADEQLVYIGIGSVADSAAGMTGDCGFVIYDDRNNSYEIIASSQSLESRNPLDGGQYYLIDKILIDRKEKIVWLAINGNSQLNGIWKYDPANGFFEHTVVERQPILDMQWADEKIVYSMYGSGLARFDPKSGEKSWLLGYVVSDFTSPEPPEPPSGVIGEPALGYAQTRLWPFAMKGDDLFTIGTQSQDVLLHRKEQTAAVKSMFDTVSYLITSKKYLASNEEGVWLVAADGQIFRLVFNQERVDEQKKKEPAGYTRELKRY